MRKIVQKQIMDMIPAIWDGVQYIQTAESENARRVLQDCLLAMKTLRESLRSGLSEIRFAYYQNFYDQAFLSLGNIERGPNPANQIPEIYTGLDTILTDITDEKEVKLEILFLPYKASMWDSLESIWLAAKDDAKCDAYVMPIPYCDRNPDGSPAAWHCEADLFPEYVPVIDFHQYDIAKRKPDVIYIHNPYDEYNYVTSVDPKYYAREIKQYTDMLVYVPYFVVMDTVAKHFCQTAGVLYADRVIVQSEVIKQQYIENWLDGNPPKDKFLALGSPKFDKVLKENKQKQILPEAWMKIINKRKVILYNTHIDALINNPDKFINKLQYVFSFFKEQSDFVLWWRPHPLGEATAQSMQPNILAKYKAIEKEYKDSEFGIFDDTADLHRAIATSDAYYGDPSSLVPMYGMTGKPILIQDIDNFGNQYSAKNDRYILFGKYAIDENKLWFVSQDCTALFTLDLRNNTIQNIHALPGENIDDLNQYCSLVKINNKLIIAPACASNIIEYDIHTDTFKTTALCELANYMKQYRLKNFKFSDIITYKSYAFFIGYGYPAIVRYDSVSGNCDYYTDWFEEIKQYISKPDDFLLGSGCISNTKDNVVFLPFLQKNIILEFDMNTGTSKIHFVGNEKNRYVGIASDGKDYWIIPYGNGSITRWNKETGKTIEYNNYPMNFKVIEDSNITSLFTSIISVDKKMWAFPGWGANMAVEIDKRTGKMQALDAFHGPYVHANKFGEFILAEFVPNDQAFLVKIDTENQLVEKKELTISNELVEKITELVSSESHKYLGTNQYCFFEKYIGRSLALFLTNYKQDYLPSSYKEKNLFEELIENIGYLSGVKIHQIICKTIMEEKK